jgi:hypothetical protein
VQDTGNQLSNSEQPAFSDGWILIHIYLPQGGGSNPLTRSEWAWCERDYPRSKGDHATLRFNLRKTRVSGDSRTFINQNCLADDRASTYQADTTVDMGSPPESPLMRDSRWDRSRRGGNVRGLNSMAGK